MQKDIYWFSLLSSRPAVSTTAVVISSSCIVASGIYIILQRRNLAIKAQNFVTNGILIVESGVSVSQKKYIWESYIKPKLVAHWMKEQNDFKDGDISTYPNPSNGKSHNMTCTEIIPNLPKLISSNFEIQILIAYLIDPSLQLVHFGTQTHWLLKIYINPLWFIFGDRFKPSNMFSLQGDDQSWHTVNVINSHGIAGQPVSENSIHIDAGDCIVYCQGLPTSNNIDESLSIEERLLVMLMSQVY